MGKRKTSRRDAADPRTILVPVDFSPHSAAALVWAANAARRSKASLVLLHVVHDPLAAPGYYARTSRKKVHKRAEKAREAVERMEDVAEDLFEDFVESVAEEHPSARELERAKRIVVVGLPATRILQIVERENVDLIVMGSQGRTGLARVMLGSKSERVTRLARVPVVIVKADDDSERDS